jgi:hypothetical protein
MKAKWASLFFPCCSLLSAAEGFYLNDSDRLVIYGEDPGRTQFDALFIGTYLATRLPAMEIEVVALPQAAVPEAAIVAARPTVLLLLQEGDRKGPDPNGPDPNRVGADATGLTAKYKAALPSLRVTTTPVLSSGTPASEAPALLSAWHAPAVVSVVEIDAAATRILRGDNTTVRDLECSSVVAWSQDDQALPLPASMAPGEGAAKINIETLRVTGLGSGRYRLSIDGWSMGEFWRESFEQGIDLALLPTPMRKQADRVHSLMAGESGRAAWRSAARPATHDYEISRVN